MGFIQKFRGAILWGLFFNNVEARWKKLKGNQLK
jgi:hypothetical protein